MSWIKYIYKIWGKPLPYYANYPLLLIVWKPIRKYINAVFGVRILVIKSILNNVVALRCTIRIVRINVENNR